MTKDETFMKEALKLAVQAKENGDEPFGAILVKDDEIVGTSVNQIHSHFDPTHHAELGLIREFCMEHQIMDLSPYTLYTSCEPCFMCSGSMVWSGLGRLVYSAGSRDLNEILGEPLVDSSKTVFAHSHYQPEVTSNILHDEGVTILEAYFSKK